MTLPKPMETHDVQAGGILFRIRPPVMPDSRKVILLLHGWTGDEGSMWIFSSRLPADAWLIAPRGLFPSSIGGFSWYPETSHRWPILDQLLPAAEKLAAVLTTESFPEIHFAQPSRMEVRARPLSVVGFSQGAALAFTFGLFSPERVKAVAGLSGFLPEEFERHIESLPYEGIQVLLAHGKRDDIVPVAKARQAVELLIRAGAQVDYCEDEVGHKLSAACFRSLEVFFQDLSSA